MLNFLRLSHFAILTECELRFSAGFTVLTGETGAGKSILIDAIGLLLGNQASEEWIQHGHEECRIEGQFTLETIPPILAEFMEDHDLLISRRFSRNRPNVIRINDQSVTLKTLKEIGLTLATIMGQHEHLSLLTPETQQEFLDYYCGSEFQKRYIPYLKSYTEYKSLLEQKEKLEKNRQDALNRLAFLKFQYQDISQFKFARGEEVSLDQQRNALKHKDKFNQALSGAEDSLNQIVTQFVFLKKQAEVLSSIDPSIEKLRLEVAEIELRAQDIQQQFIPYRSTLEDLSGINLDQVESRLHQLYKLKNTYHTPTLDELLDKADALKTEIQQIESLLGEDESQAHFLKMRDEVEALAKELHEIRKKKAVVLAKAIEALLTDLEMPHAKVQISVQERQGKDALTATGISIIEFLLSTNPGEPPKALQKVVSGGELSRVMLAIRTLFYDYAPVPTLIYDEVDTGIGGLTALKVGEFLKKSSAKAQVLCVTHLAQIAKFSDAHLKVSKQVEPNLTVTSIQLLAPEEIPQELERMVGGLTIKKILLQNEKH